MECPTCPKTKKRIFVLKIMPSKGPWVYMGICLKVDCSTFWHLCSIFNYIVLLVRHPWTWNFSSRNPSIDRLIRWCCIELQKIHYTSSSRIIQLLLLLNEDCFDKTANVFIGCCLRIPNFANLKSSALNDDQSLNLLDFHMNKVPTLQNAWAIKIN